jgi:hypothetical protein
VRKNTLNFVVDLAALVVMLALVATGLLLYFILVPGSRGGQGLALWGWSRHDWGDLHFWLSLSLLALIILHVILHWDWVCFTVRRWVSPAAARTCKMSVGAQWLWGLALTVAVVGLVGGFLGLAVANLTRGADDEHGHLNNRRPAQNTAEPGAGLATGEGAGGAHDAEEIRGSMTLRSAAAVAGVDVELLKRELGLPASVSGEERLGRLCKDYGLEMSAIRAAVSRLAKSGSESSDNSKP